MTFYTLLILQEKHKPTVDDLHSKTFIIQNSKLKVDFLDTSGDDEVSLNPIPSEGRRYLIVPLAG